MRPMCGRFDRLARDEFDVDDTTYRRLRTAVERWQERLLRLELRRERDTGLDREDDLGLDL